MLDSLFHHFDLSSQTFHHKYFLDWDIFQFYWQNCHHNQKWSLHHHSHHSNLWVIKMTEHTTFCPFLTTFPPSVYLLFIWKFELMHNKCFINRKLKGEFHLIPEHMLPWLLYPDTCFLCVLRCQNYSISGQMFPNHFEFRHLFPRHLYLRQMIP